MSLNFANVSMAPNPLTTGSKIVISVEVWDDEFEFDELATAYDRHQGFADEAQTIGGMLVDFVIENKAITLANGDALYDVDGNAVIQNNTDGYTSTHTGAEIDAFITEVNPNG